MLSVLSRLTESTVTATDGEIGQVEAAFFDDRSWTIRYLVVDTGTWLSGREVLISPYSVKQPLGSGKGIDVSLTRQQVENSPDIDTHQPVSRQHERELQSHYAYPAYWEGEGLWAMNAYPYMPAMLPTAEQDAARRARLERDIRTGDVHLRSSERVAGYDIQASDDSIGHVEDFIFDAESWTIRYLAVDTRNWWPGGRKVLIGTHWIERIDFPSATVQVKLTREQVRNSPVYDEAATVSRDFESRLHAAYGRPGYWDKV